MLCVLDAEVGWNWAEMGPGKGGDAPASPGCARPSRWDGCPGRLSLGPGRTERDDARRPPGRVGQVGWGMQPSRARANWKRHRQARAVLEVADGGFDLGVATVVGLQLQGAAGPVGDEWVVVVVGEQGEL